MLTKQLNSFGIRRYGIPIDKVSIKDSIDPGITTSISYTVWDAAIAAGATLDELLKIDEYPREFQAKLVAWHRGHKMIDMHSKAAVADVQRRKAKKK